MGKQANAEEKTNEKGEMKELLWNWGQAMERYRWKEAALQKAEAIYESERTNWEQDGTEEARRELKRAEEEYKRETERIRQEMAGILREKARVDNMIGKMTMDEEMFIKLRFGKKCGFDYISVKMHLSRATLFRMQDRVLRKMLLCRNENETILRPYETRKKVC